MSTTFGERLKRARERSELSQKEAAALLGVTDKSLSRYENNTTFPSFDTLSAFVRVYDVSTDYLMGFSASMGHAPIETAGTSRAAPRQVVGVHEKLDGLSPSARKKATEYIEMLKTLDEVQSGDNLVDLGKKA